MRDRKEAKKGRETRSAQTERDHLLVFYRRKEIAVVLVDSEKSVIGD
jgi:hypothetical protein